MKRTMIRTICAGCAAVLALGICPAFGASAAAEPAFSFRALGDANNDGKVSSIDAQDVLVAYVEALAQGEKIPASDDPATDVNMDGVIDVKDANSILQYYCQTLAGNQPLWSDYRAVSEVEGYQHYNLETNEYEFLTAGKEGMFIEIGVASGKAGDTVTVPVYLSGAPILAGFQFYLNNSSGAQLTGVRTTFAKQIGEDLEDTYVTNPDPEWGAIVWVSSKGKNLNAKNGMVIGEYTYQIPEDAQPGTAYQLSLDKENTMFITSGEEFEANGQAYSNSDCTYQFTLLDGVIVVE
ncbi:MAG: hypothetical protein IKI77_00340 [Oscillospiraceae bacterium]|nr:hypothetical protein [Oscillospiraceae bacterium]